MRGSIIRRASLALCAFAVIAASGVAMAQAQLTPAEAIQHRQEQLRRLGASFKAANDQLRSHSPDLAVVRTSAQSIATLAEDFPNWFPQGSGPGPGLDTHAKAEIWSNAAGFGEQVSQLQAAAQSFNQVSAGSDVAAITASARALGARCASCHTDFRERS